MSIHPDDRELVMGNYQRALRTGKAYVHEYRLLGADGKYRWFLSGAEPLRGEHGQIVRWYGSGVDIDDWKRAEDKLRDLRT
jgi:PAS domain S-box-containing protein